MLFPVILCGGSGTRLWPLSRSSYPKQFVDLGQGRTLFKDTVKRALKVSSDVQSPVVVTSKTHRFYAQADLNAEHSQGEIIVEPLARNTAPAIAVAAFYAQSKDSEAVLLVLPSDHAITEESVFAEAVRKAVDLAKLDFLVTFGITPTGPETGFGYIKAGAPVSEEGFRVEEFVEKPGEDSAKRMLEQGGFSWNSGMFVFKAGTFLQELEKRAPDVYATAKLTFEHSDSDGNVLTLNPDFFSKCPNISIDYAVMEKTDKAAVLPVTLHWTDLGSWSAFYDSAKKDSSGNALIGDTLCLDTKNSYIRSTNRLVATVGVDNLAIIETQDAVLVSPIDKSQEVRAIVDRLKKDNRPEAVIHNLVYRPWGSYESLAKGERFQVKRIIVQPGEELSLQLHHHRAEHWIVVAGTAEVQVGTSVKLFTENQSTYIPVGEIHRMRNPGKIPLVIIEVQSGSYLGEDDIVRLEDKYKRI